MNTTEYSITCPKFPVHRLEVDGLKESRTGDNSHALPRLFDPLLESPAESQ